MKERSLVAFTLLGQAAVGLAWALLAAHALGEPPGGRGALPLLLVGALTGGAAVVSLLHLGSPRAAWRALAALRRSWLSREIAWLLVFAAAWAGVAGAHAMGVGGGARAALALVLALAGGGLLHAMGRVYRLRTVPAWDTALTPTAFLLAAGSLGFLAGGLLLGSDALLLAGGAFLAAELALEPLWWTHRRRAAGRADPGLFPAPTALPLARPVLLAAALGAVLLGAPLASGWSAAAWLAEVPASVALLAAGTAAVLGRVAFYDSHARLGL